MINRLIKTFEFSEDTRKEIVFSEPSKIRLDPYRSKSLPPALELKNTNNKYPTDQFLYVRSQIFEPKGVQKWLLLDDDSTKPVNTDIKYRMGSIVGNTEEEYYFDGSNWQIATNAEYAQATFTVVDYTQLSNKYFSIAGLQRKESEQWSASISNDATAASIAEDINTFAGVVATVVNNVITVKSKAKGSFANSIALVTSDAVNLLLSGPTLTGGIDSQFNTIAQINLGLPTLLSFIVNTRNGSKKIFVSTNLSTSDGNATPLLRTVKLLGQFEIEWMEDIIYDTIRRELHNKVRYTADLEVTAKTATNTIDLSTDDYEPDNEGYNVVGVESVYNMSQDPLRLSNLFQSYAQGSLNQDNETNKNGIITLSSSVAQDDVLWIKLKVVPEIAVNTDQDFYEVKKLPSIVLEKIEAITVGRSTSKYMGEQGRDFVKNLANGTAVEILPPAIQDLRIGFSVLAPSQVDLQRLTIAIQKYFNENVVVKTHALDEKVTQILTVELEESQIPNLNDVNTASGVFVLKSVPFYLKESVDSNIVTDVNLSILPS